MTNERNRIPQDPKYFETLGLAAMAFARLEWDAVWCCERLSPNYIKTIETERKTAGIIAKDLERQFLQIADEELRSRITTFAEEFRQIVRERNSLVHGKPATVKTREQRLTNNGMIWTIELIDAFSDRCTLCSIELNALLHNEFKKPCKITASP